MTFIDHVTVIPADWLNFVNNFINTAPGGTGPLPVASGGTGTTTSTGSGNTVLSNAPTLTTPTLVAPAITGGSVDGHGIGYKEVPINPKSADYTLALTDEAAAIYHPTADPVARTWTIPANSVVAFPVGTEITFVNDNAAGVLTIAIGGTDTMRLAGAGTTGNRTLAANGLAAALKVTTTSWIINGTGLT